jgi:phosphoribosylformylglycinamidine synthase
VNLKSHGLPTEFVLFGEDASRVVLSCDAGNLARIQQVAGDFGLFADLLGETGGDRVEIALDGNTMVSATVAELGEVYENALERALRTEPSAVAAD